jgi:hypothetical protein
VAADAGVYIPTLARELLRRRSASINLRGLWVTDPCTDNAAQFGWLDLGVSFAWQARGSSDLTCLGLTCLGSGLAWLWRGFAWPGMSTCCGPLRTISGP